MTTRTPEEKGHAGEDRQEKRREEQRAESRRTEGEVMESRGVDEEAESNQREMD